MELKITFQVSVKFKLLNNDEVCEEVVGIEQILAQFLNWVDLNVFTV